MSPLDFAIGVVVGHIACFVYYVIWKMGYDKGSEASTDIDRREETG